MKTIINQLIPTQAPKPKKQGNKPLVEEYSCDEDSGERCPYCFGAMKIRIVNGARSIRCNCTKKQESKNMRLVSSGQVCPICQTVIMQEHTYGKVREKCECDNIGVWQNTKIYTYNVGDCHECHFPILFMIEGNRSWVQCECNRTEASWHQQHSCTTCWSKVMIVQSDMCGMIAVCECDRES